MQDLIDIGFGYDETDPFIDNSEAVSSPHFTDDHLTFHLSLFPGCHFFLSQTSSFDLQYRIILIAPVLAAD